MTELYALVPVICIDITETSLRAYRLWHFSKDVNEIEIFNVQKLGARGSTVGWGTALQVGRTQVQFPMVSLEFLIDIILPAAL
jgi:hypothetical protein